MDGLMLGLYVLSLGTCCICLWLWYELDTAREHIANLRSRVMSQDDRLEQLERKQRR